MMTTVKLSATRRIVVEPREGGVMLELNRKEADGLNFQLYAVLTPDQCGALIFALEQACEVGQLSAIRGSAETLNDKG